ncbi:MAG: 3-dehydroquinate synthase [Christensenellales bacterium]|jgi:3-dehydroquinate synthase
MSAILQARGAIDRAGAELARAFAPGTAAVISDDHVMGLYGARVEQSLADAGFRVVKFMFPHGEGSKNLQVYGEILHFLAENEVTRADAVVALGGGVVGDIAGFAAATYLRGVGLMQIPTTLLACVDSSVGGKTAIDLPEGKNLAGAFYQPDIVLIDPDTLRTLPEDVFRDGAAEVIKYAAIRDAGMFDDLPRIREGIDGIISRCVEIKREIVGIDERDKGIRQILNFGHTFGHAIEKLSGYAVSHGAAVAIGMAMMARACAEKGLLGRASAERLIAAIREMGHAVSCEYAPDDIFRAALSDKKRAGGEITLVILRELGECALHKASLDEARSFVEMGWAAW